MKMIFSQLSCFGFLKKIAIQSACLLVGLIPVTILAQSQAISGQVFELNSKGEESPLAAAVVFWPLAQKGSVANSEGRFTLNRVQPSEAFFIVRHIGYADDTIKVTQESFYKVILMQPLESKEVEIRAKSWSSFVSFIDPYQTEILSQRELTKAACCDLSESFSTNSSVDVESRDAVTGAREIKILGLTSRYGQIMTERMPLNRGLNFLYGLNYIPGSWIESISISKGSGPVDGGYESTTGEINICLRDPVSAEKLFVNVYGNIFGRFEANVHSAFDVGEKASTILMAHGNLNRFRLDNDKDGFLNYPMTTRGALLNRWKFKLGKGWESQVSLKGVWEDRLGGQVAYKPGDNLSKIYGIVINTRRIEGFAKLGHVWANRPTRSIGSQFSGFYHVQNAHFGKRNYGGIQENFRVNLLFSEKFERAGTDHTLKAGVSFLMDRFKENLQINQTDSLFNRQEYVPGVWAEYTLNLNTRFSAVAGMRVDYHNLFGLMLTPRLHLKYAPWEKTTFRVSGGRGFRTANLIAENLSFVASSRAISVLEAPRQEEAWTFGASFIQGFTLADREGYVSTDYYRTQFSNQLLIDIEDPRSLRFYNLAGKSFSNSAQIEVVWEALEKLDLKIAGKYQDVRSRYLDGKLKQVPFTPAFRGLFNAGYQYKKWLFDATVAYTGPQRIPSTADNPYPDRLPERSPGFVTLNAQVTRQLKNWDIYLGGENLSNYVQKSPLILGADDPYGPNFDAAMIWGPIMGVMAYAGFRYSIPRLKEKETDEGQFNPILDSQKEGKIKPSGKVRSLVIKTSSQCGMCKKTIEGAVNALPGIKKAALDLASGKITVRYWDETIQPGAIREAISAVGYDADEVKADPEVYKKLDECCKKPN